MPSPTNSPCLCANCRAHRADDSALATARQALYEIANAAEGLPSHDYVRRVALLAIRTTAPK
jgi:hypothetical protein